MGIRGEIHILGEKAEKGEGLAFTTEYHAKLWDHGREMQPRSNQISSPPLPPLPSRCKCQIAGFCASYTTRDQARVGDKTTAKKKRRGRGKSFDPAKSLLARSPFSGYMYSTKAFMRLKRVLAASTSGTWKSICGGNFGPEGFRNWWYGDHSTYVPTNFPENMNVSHLEHPDLPHGDLLHRRVLVRLKELLDGHQPVEKKPWFP